MNTDRTQSNLYRHQCEVRFLLEAGHDQARGEKWVRDYLNHPKVAGRTAVLTRDVEQQKALGNDGRHGLWL